MLRLFVDVLNDEYLLAWALEGPTAQGARIRGACSLLTTVPSRSPRRTSSHHRTSAAESRTFCLFDDTLW